MIKSRGCLDQELTMFSDERNEPLMTRGLITEMKHRESSVILGLEIGIVIVSRLLCPVMVGRVAVKHAQIRKLTPCKSPGPVQYSKDTPKDTAIRPNTERDRPSGGALAPIRGKSIRHRASQWPLIAGHRSFHPTKAPFSRERRLKSRWGWSCPLASSPAITTNSPMLCKLLDFS